MHCIALVMMPIILGRLRFSGQVEALTLMYRTDPHLHSRKPTLPTFEKFYYTCRHPGAYAGAFGMSGYYKNKLVTLVTKTSSHTILYKLYA